MNGTEMGGSWQDKGQHGWTIFSHSHITSIKRGVAGTDFLHGTESVSRPFFSFLPLFPAGVGGYNCSIT